MSGIKRTLYLISGGSITLMFVFFALFVRTNNNLMLIIAVLMLNAAFQVIARLLIGTICEGVFENGINSSGDWYKTSAFEDRLYGTLNIKGLKKFLPTFERTDFSLKKDSIQYIIDTGCEVEVEHELCIAASMLGVLFALIFGKVWLFAIVAATAVIYDLLFVVVQRFNRSRLITVQLKRRARFFEKIEATERISEQNNAQMCDTNSIQQATALDGCEEEKE